MQYDIVKSTTIEGLVDTIRQGWSGWETQGAPFYDLEGRRWCQAMTKLGPAPVHDEMKLKEPAPKGKK